MTDPMREALKAERAELMAKNQAATSWGAAAPQGDVREALRNLVALVSTDSAYDDSESLRSARNILFEANKAAAAIDALVPGTKSLFSQQDFVGAGGLPLTWKIECDALSNADLETIAAVCAPKLPKFCQAVGVPRGGLKLAAAMNAYADPDSKRVLIVDDVWTTGRSMTAVGASYAGWIGFVAFARGPLPPHVKSFMQAGDALVPGDGVGEATLRKALETCREFIKGDPVENEVVCIGSMQSLGEMIDEAIASQNEGGEPCGIHQKSDGRWGCIECNRSWDTSHECVRPVGRLPPADDAAVAWRFKYKPAGDWFYSADHPSMDIDRMSAIEPLFTHPAQAVDVDAVGRAAFNVLKRRGYLVYRLRDGDAALIGSAVLALLRDGNGSSHV